MPTETTPINKFGVFPHNYLVIELVRACWETQHEAVRYGFANAFSQFKLSSIRPINFSLSDGTSTFTQRAATCIRLDESTGQRNLVDLYKSQKLVQHDVINSTEWQPATKMDLNTGNAVWIATPDWDKIVTILAEFGINQIFINEEFALVMEYMDA